ncbi:ankyrin repeat-containing domain protein [Dendryphion nanum]|uniref:Ankyrin repeat-containing domain protein n=1 Tax=Dendryphion nanum TaxID=256645 RepID=A0A9P9DQR2_9PLEO|nr:ankyrin repeat-containing domain protein [Dendryphion nanum]
MLLEKLPVELVYKVIATAAADAATTSEALQLREVNHLFEEEATKCFFREREHSYSTREWTNVSFAFRFRWTHDLIFGPKKEDRQDIARYWNQVISNLEEFAKAKDPENSGRITRQQWTKEVCEILARHDADCQCGRPAFVHLNSYDNRIQDTAFHVAFIKKHTELEIAMINDGRATYDSNCPYIQVHERDVEKQRKNALEWAIQEGLTDTAMRLIATVTDEQRTDVDWETTLLVAAYKGNIPVIEWLLAPECPMSRREFIVIQATRDAAKGKHWDAVRAICERFPHEKCQELLDYAAEQGQWELAKSYIQADLDGGRRQFEKYFRAALQGAAKGGHFEIYRDLLDWWEEENNKVDDGVTLSHKVRHYMAPNIARGGNADVLRLHLDRGNSLRPMELICYAASEGHLELVKMLWSKEDQDKWEDGMMGDENSDDVSRCALILAVRRRQLETVQWLLDRVDVEKVCDLKNEVAPPEEMNLLAMAVDTGSCEMVELLLNAKAKLSPELWQIGDLNFSTKFRQWRVSCLQDYIRGLGDPDMYMSGIDLNWASQRQVDKALSLVRPQSMDRIS